MAMAKTCVRWSWKKVAGVPVQLVERLVGAAGAVLWAGERRRSGEGSLTPESQHTSGTREGHAATDNGIPLPLGKAGSGCVAPVVSREERHAMEAAVLHHHADVTLPKQRSPWP